MTNVISNVPNPPPSTVIVKYNGNRLYPAPLISFTISSVFDDVGVRQVDNTKLTLTGSVLVIPSGSYEVMFQKQLDLRDTFSTDFKDFLILAGDGNHTLPTGSIISSGLRPKVTSLNIAADPQFNRIDYTVELEDNPPVSGVSGVTSSFSNQWNFREDQDNCTVRLTHNVSAQGIQQTPGAFDNAIRKVKANLGIDKLPIQIPSFTEPNASGLWGFIHPSNPAGGPIFEISVQREETADVANGSYSATEVFVIVSGVPFYFTQRTFGFTEDQNGIASVTIQGTVQGLGRTLTQNLPEGGVGFQRALSGFLNQVKPQIPFDASGVYIKYKPIAITSMGSGLNVVNPQSITITENRCHGTVDFSYQFTDNPQAFLPSGIVSRQCTVTRQEPVRIFASHPIPFRRLGPLLQDMKTTGEGTISLQCQAQAKNNTVPRDDTNRAILFVQSELNRLKGEHVNQADYVTVRITAQDQNFSETDLTASASVTFGFTVDLPNAPNINSDITLRTIP